MRCTEASYAPDPENNPHELCGKHHDVWHTGGRPDLRVPAEPSSGAAIVAPVGIEAELEAKRIEARDAFQIIREHVKITEQSHMDAAAIVLGQCKSERKRLEAIKASICDPLKLGLRRAEALCNAPIEYYESAEKDIKEKIKAFELAQRAEQDRALAAVEAAAKLGGGTVAEAQELAEDTTLAVAHGLNNLVLPQGVTTREKWSFEITDAAAVDRSLCCPDLKLIAQQIALLPDEVKIAVMRQQDGVLCPGVKLIRDMTIVNNV
jgi:hypothetical protein